MTVSWIHARIAAGDISPADGALLLEFRREMLRARRRRELCSAIFSLLMFAAGLALWALLVITAAGCGRGPSTPVCKPTASAVSTTDSSQAERCRNRN